MKEYEVNHYVYKIIHGIPIDVRRCPDRDYGKSSVNSPNIDSEDAWVCLSCTEKKCTGTKHCYEKRLGMLLRQMSDSRRKNTGKNKR